MFFSKFAALFYVLRRFDISARHKMIHTENELTFIADIRIGEVFRKQIKCRRDRDVVAHGDIQRARTQFTRCGIFFSGFYGENPPGH